MSENYRALTRKYRPNSFEDIVSQDHVINTLKNAIKQNRLSHAYMFCGPRGVGKTTIARVLARTINEVDDSVDGEALNQTLNIIEMDAASNNKVEDVHHLRESVRIPPQNGRYKIFIVDEVHMLSKAAFNALLKTLEEPPEHVIFIFATTEPHKVLPTILSRVQRFDFKRISVDEIVNHLRKISVDEKITIDEESLHVIAKKADGALRDALGLMDQAIAFCGETIEHNELLKALNVVGTDRLFAFMECVKTHDANAGLELINTLLQEGYDIQEFLIGLTEHLRNLYIAHHNKQLYLVEASEETKQRYHKSAPDFSRDDLIRMLHIVSEAQIKLKDASQPRIQFEITLLKLIHMQRSEALSKLLAELDDLKKNSQNFVSNSAPASIKKETPVQNAVARQQAKPKPEPEKPEISTPHPTEDYHEFDIGKPAIETDLSIKAKEYNASPSSFVALKRLDEPETEDTQEGNPPKKLVIEDIRAVWPEYLLKLSDKIPMILRLTVERVKPSRLKGSELILECENALAKKMLDEQAVTLSKILKECVGTLLNIKTVVFQHAENGLPTKSPYERFKELQQKDPIIRELVERLGAELEY